MRKLLGITLGIMTALGGFVDFGQIVFTLQAGAAFRYALLWPIVLGTIAIIVYSEQSQSSLYGDVRTYRRRGAGAGTPSRTIAPLRGISALTDLLIQRNAKKLDESSTECAGLIVNKVKRMQALITGLLEYAAATEKADGRISPEQKTLIDCNRVLEQARLDQDSAIKLSGAQITVSPLPSVPAIESQLVQVFSNLISNATKYCPSVRQPQIHISASEPGDDWFFCVRDNGIGLDMKYADDIFGLFKRLHGEGQFEGSGIGLALCKTVIQRHGGRIWVESEIGKGCGFFFTLPKGIGNQTLTENHQALAATHMLRSNDQGLYVGGEGWGN